MAKKPKRPTEILEKKNHEAGFDITNFVRGVFNDDYILVIGSGVILNRDLFPDSDGDINKYIVKLINEERQPKRGKDFVPYRNFMDIFMDTPPNEEDPIYDLLANGYEYLTEEISEELRLLLETKLFKFVLTTTIDNYVEMLMRTIWGDELRIVNIEDNQSLKDFQTALAECRFNKYSQPTLFYVFGKAIQGKSKPRTFVETDMEAVKIIEKWIKLESGQEHIIPFLKEKSLLALGCKFSDWYFRFFWYMLTRSFGQNENDDNKDFITDHNLAISFDETLESDRDLSEYLKRIGVCMHGDVWGFMKKIHELLTSTAPESPYRNMILEKRREGGVFISYHSPDVNMANEVFCKLTKDGKLNVWFDNIKLYGGDNYKNEIQRAISKCKIFVPILSPLVAQELKEYGIGISTFYSDEWRWAAETSTLIIPLAINGYNLRGDEHKIFERIIGENRCATGIDMRTKPTNHKMQEKVGFAKLLDSIEKQLNLY